MALQGHPGLGLSPDSSESWVGPLGNEGPFLWLRCGRGDPPAAHIHCLCLLLAPLEIVLPKEQTR